MNAHRTDRETVERLLGGSVIDPRDALHPLALLLAALRAAPLASELDGEQAAVRAFRRARTLPPPPAAPARVRRTLTGIGVRAALAALAVAATGGVALAATGTLPGGSPPPATVGPPPPVEAPSVAPGAPASSPSGRPSASPPTSPAATDAELCTTYRARSGDKPGRELENPAFAGLVAAAGGRDRVPGYCDRLLGDDKPRGESSGRPSHPARPQTSPPGRPDEPGAGGQHSPAARGRPFTDGRPAD